jgi:hypothetical protein
MVADCGCELLCQPKVQQDELQLPPDFLRRLAVRQGFVVPPPHQNVAGVEISASFSTSENHIDATGRNFEVT